MKQHIFIFGMGYTSGYLASHLRSQGWRVSGTRREADATNLAFGDHNAVEEALMAATHILSSVPPKKEGGDPVLEVYAEAIQAASANWIGYLSSTGVYGDTQGAWVDETATIGTGRRSARSSADLGWQKLRNDIRIFRLPGIYGPGRSAIERVSVGKARRIDLPGQVFSRVHVDDIASGILASMDGLAGIYNLSDDRPCPQNKVIEYACDLTGAPYPLLKSLEDAGLSQAAIGFYAENRRVSNGKAKRLLDWKPRYPTYKQGLSSIFDMKDEKAD